MKHLLIIFISILLLSSPLIGQETGVLYLWDTSSGQVWKTFKDKDTQPKYQGQVKDGKPNGLGSLTYPDGSKYVGEWKDDKYHGQGTWFGKGEWKGQKYVGEYKDGKEWNGKLYDKNGNIIGKYVNGNYRTP